VWLDRGLNTSGSAQRRFALDLRVDLLT